MIIFIELKELQHVTLQLENVLIWTTVSSHFALKKKKKILSLFITIKVHIVILL